MLAIGLVNCGIHNECDPALALLSEYVNSSSLCLRIGAVLGLGLAYAGSRRKDVTELLTGALTNEQSEADVITIIISMSVINLLVREIRDRGVFDLTLDRHVEDKIDILQEGEIKGNVFPDNVEISSLTAIALGLVNVGSGDSDVSSAILLKLLGLCKKELAVTHSRLLIDNMPQ